MKYRHLMGYSKNLDFGSVNVDINKCDELYYDDEYS